MGESEHAGADPGKEGRIAAFVSIPRNASTTVRTVLGLGRNRDLDDTTSPVVHENHQRAAVLQTRYDLDRLFVFCFVRNPYDRCASWYKFHNALEPYRRLSFPQWVEAGLPHHWTQQNQTHYVASRISPLLQYNFVRGCKLDFIGRVETLDRDLKTLIDQLSFVCRQGGRPNPFTQSAAHLEKLNESPPWPPSEELHTPRTRQIIRSILSEDFEHFGYDPECGTGR